MNKRFLIHHKTRDIDAFIDFLRLSKTHVFETSFPDFLLLETSDEEDGITLPHLRELCLQEIYHDFTGFELPESDYLDVPALYSTLRKIGFGTFDIASLLSTLSRKNYEEKEAFRHLFLNQFGRDTIDTVLGFVENDLNASKASKALYMHRNTLNYRLDHFIGKSGLDVRTFPGALAIFLLFK